MTVGGNSNINLVDSSGIPGTIAGINVGRDGTGSLTITGGQITINAPSAGATAHGLAVGGSTASVTDNGVGTLTISGANSQITMQTGGVIIGRNGHGTLNMSGGAKIDGSTQTLSSGVGFETNGVGVASLTCAGTEWSAGANNLYIGTNNISGAMTGTGTLSVANGAQVTAANVIVGQGGALTGNGGIIAGNVTNYGTIAPGSSPGTMIVLGDMTLDDLGTVALELGGTGAGQYDHMDISGNMTLDGTLNVSMYGGYLPTAGSFFDVFTALDVTVGSPIFDFQYVEGIAWSYEIVAGDGNESVRILASAAPEPVTIALFGAGLGGLALVRRRRRH
jgi:T5SS/PEP-CTERM-associated repeat protein